MATVIALMCALSAKPNSSLVFASRLATPTGKPTVDADRDGGGRDDPTPTATPVVTECGWLPVVKKEHPYLLDYESLGMRGVAGAAYVAAGDFDEDAVYDWNVGGSTFGTTRARMVWCASDIKPDPNNRVPWYGTSNYSNPITMAAQADYADFRGRVWLFLNEPDLVGDQCGDYTVTVRTTGEVTHVWSVSGAQEMAHRYLETRDLILGRDPSANVYPAGIAEVLGGSPGDPKGGHPWWEAFINEISSTVGSDWRDEIDGVHLHGYPGHIDSNPSRFGCDIDIGNDQWCVDEARDALEYYYTEILSDEMGLQDRPIWISESGGPNSLCSELSATYGIWSTQAYTEVAENIADPMAAWMTGNNNPGYDKLLWYVTWTAHDYGASWCTFLYTNTTWISPTFVPSSTLNPLGETWADGDW